MYLKYHNSPNFLARDVKFFVIIANEKKYEGDNLFWGEVGLRWAWDEKWVKNTNHSSKNLSLKKFVSDK